MRSFFCFTIHHPLFLKDLRSYLLSIIGCYSFLGLAYLCIYFGIHVPDRQIADLLMLESTLALGSTLVHIWFWIERYRFAMDSKVRIDE